MRISAEANLSGDGEILNAPVATLLAAATNSYHPLAGAGGLTVTTTQIAVGRASLAGAGLFDTFRACNFFDANESNSEVPI